MRILSHASPSIVRSDDLVLLGLVNHDLEVNGALSVFSFEVGVSDVLRPCLALNVHDNAG